MNIVFVLGYPTRSRGGIENAALAFAKGLAARGHDVSALFNHGGELVPEYAAFCRDVVVLDQPRRFARLAALVIRWAWAGGSFIYGHQAKNIFPMWILAKLTRSRLVSHVHLPPPERVDRLMQVGLGGTSRFIFVSTSTLALWAQQVSFDRSRASVVRNGVDTNRFTPSTDPAGAKRPFGLDGEDRVIAFIGRLDRFKGVHILIDAFRMALERRPDLRAHLLIAGSAVVDGDDYPQELRESAARLPHDAVRFVGRIQDPVGFYRAADLVVIPSIWPDPQPLVTTESLACGVPVIASRIGGIPEILEPFFPEFLVEPGSADQLAGKLLQFIEWRRDAPDLGDRCRQLAQSEFGLDQCIERIEAAFATPHDDAFQARVSSHAIPGRADP